MTPDQKKALIDGAVTLLVVGLKEANQDEVDAVLTEIQVKLHSDEPVAEEIAHAVFDVLNVVVELTPTSADNNALSIVEHLWKVFNGESPVGEWIKHIKEKIAERKAAKAAK